MISGEVGRGIAFLGGYMFGFGITAMLLTDNSILEADESFSEGITLFIEAQVIGGIFCFVLLAYNALASTDAIKVAKINNLAWRDNHNTGTRLTIKPFNHTISNNNLRSTGLTIQVTF